MDSLAISSRVIKYPALMLSDALVLIVIFVGPLFVSRTLGDSAIVAVIFIREFFAFSDLVSFVEDSLWNGMR